MLVEDPRTDEKMTERPSINPTSIVWSIRTHANTVVSDNVGQLTI